MEIKEFAQKARAAVQAELGDDYQVETTEVRKNNGVVLCGLRIMSSARNVAPTIYLEDYLEAYEDGLVSMPEVVRRIVDIYRENVPAHDKDMGFFRSFKKVKDRICYRLAGRDSNLELLQEIPHVDYLDMAIYFFYAFQDDTIGEGSILVQNSYMEYWDTDTDELMRIAQENTPRLFPCACVPMEDIMMEITGKVPGDDAGDDLPQVPMKVLTNRQQLHGASCVLYPGILEKLARDMGTGFYIIPSSVHEVLLLPDTCDGDPEGIKAMIASINREQVPPEDVLSGSLYHYDPAAGEIKIL